LFAAVLAAGSGAALAQYPAKPVRIVVPFAPGGATDAVLRLIGPRLSENLGQQVIIENRPGGGATIGMDAVAKAAPDGYMVGVANLSFAVNPSFFAKLPYNTERDFALVGMITKTPLVLTVHPSLPARNLKELTALAKSKPGDLYYSSSGNASASQMMVELYAYLSGIRLTHVPYTGGGPALISVLSGQVSICPVSIPVLLPHYQAGKLRPLGITTAQRDPAIPDVPTIAEGGVAGYDATEFQGLVVPANTPQAAVVRLNQDMVKALRAPDLAQRFASVGAHPVGSTPEEFAAYMRKELQIWSKVIKAAGIKAD
jgi:tripartite-type tricarboxylate transporter receptor subunit TctC